MAKEKKYVVAKGKAIAAKNGVITEGEDISWKNMPDPLQKKDMDALGEQAVNELKKKNFKALADSKKNLVVEKAAPYVPPDEPDVPDEPEKKEPEKPDKKTGGAKRK